MNKIYQKAHPAGKNAGFTLIELLVVVLIIGILAAVALPQYTKAVEKSRLMKWAPLLKALANAEEAYWMANGQYTPKIEDLDVNFPGGSSLAGASSDSGFVTFSDGTQIDLLQGEGYISSANSVNSRVRLKLKNETVVYFQFFANSAYPNTRFCGKNESVCKSLGGTKMGYTIDNFAVWKLP